MSEVELVAVVDHHDRVIGEIERSQLADRQLNFRVVHVLVLDPAGRLLVQVPAASLRRSFRFGSSVAGHVRSGEGYQQAARREYREELGVAAPDLDFVGTTWLDEGERRKFIGVFLATEQRPLAPDPSEVEHLEWLPIEAAIAAARGDGVVSETFKTVLRFVRDHRALSG